MSKHTPRVLPFLALLGYCSLATAQPLTLVRNNQPQATIVVQAKAPERVAKAAVDLQYYIQKISGVKLPLKTDGKDVPGITLNVGKTASSQPGDFPAADSNPETYAIHRRGDDLYFTGNYPTPTAFAVYSFLQDQLGVRWFAPDEDWEYVPHNEDRSTLAVDVQNVVSSPDTSPRLWSGNQWAQDWNLRNKVVAGEKIPWKNFQRNPFLEILPPSQYGAAHPEYYPLVGGKRWIPPSDSTQRWWACMGNEDVQRLTIEYIRWWFKEHPNEDTFSLGFDDVKQMCGCPLCRAMDEHPDDHEKREWSNRYYKFINIVAREVKKSDPDKYLGLLIYDVMGKLPSQVPTIEDNVFGYIANGSVAQWHEPSKKEDWVNHIRAWSKRVKHLSRYDYYGVFSFVPRVFPHDMDAALKLDKSLGLEGMKIETNAFYPHTAPMLWVFAQLEWNSQKNVDELLHDFYSKMFPATTSLMQEYFGLMENSWNTARPGHVGYSSGLLAQAVAISPEAVQEGFKLLDQAYEQASTPAEKRRIDVVRGGLRYASYLVLEYDLIRQIAALPVNEEKQAEAGLNKAAKLAALMNERGKFWPEAKKRQDLLGANLRFFQERLEGKHGETPSNADIAPLERSAIPGILKVLHWYRTHQPARAPGVTKSLMEKLPAGFVDEALEASTWLAQAEQTGEKSLLKNGDFESAAQNTSKPEQDWYTAGLPAGWSAWSRRGHGKYVRTPGRAPDSTGIHAIVPPDGDNNTATLLQTVPVQAGQRYVCAVWVKPTTLDSANDAQLSVKFRGVRGWLSGQGSSKWTTAFAPDSWQRLILTAVAPPGATSVTVMLEANRQSSAIFDDAVFYHMPS